MSNFSHTVYIQTKHLHDIVDKHRFVRSIKRDSLEAIHYINTIETILSILERHMDKSNKLHNCLRRIPQERSFFVQPNQKLFDKVQKDTQNPLLYLSQIYLWYLSLMAGGRILVNYYGPEYHHLFYFDSSDKLYLKSIVNDIPPSNRQKFINNVSQMYILIKEYFDDFYTTS